jgi:putative heme-binding domain-containing protein
LGTTLRGLATAGLLAASPCLPTRAAESTAALPPPDADGFISLFDGHDLNGWDGDPKLWSVQDGAIVGETTPQNRTRGTYLFRAGVVMTNFELRASFRLLGGNSGIQYRSRQLPDWQVAGYQADMDDANEYTGIIYEVGDRAIMAPRGQKLVFDAAGNKRLVGSLGTPQELLAAIHHRDWNQYTIIARGDHLIQEINGRVMVDVIDHDARRIRSGLIAFQLHPGPPMRVEFKDIRYKPLPPTPGSPSGRGPRAARRPQWIWGARTVRTNQTFYFRKTFTVEGPNAKARLTGTCDDAMVVYLNGRELAHEDLWRNPVHADATPLLRPGPNVLAVRGRNVASVAGLCLRLRIVTPGHPNRWIVTDQTWQVRPDPVAGWNGETAPSDGWAPAVALGPLGMAPWGNILAIRSAVTNAVTATPVSQIRMLVKGFQVELLYSPTKTQGSWVSMCVDPQGRLIVCDQYNQGLYRITPPPPGGSPALTRVEKIDVPLSGAQGLVWAFHSLYALVTKDGKYNSGLYRVRDTNGDDQLDTVELLHPLGGGGDHGWHSLLLGPDGKSIYAVAGDATIHPKLAGSRVPLDWGEDQLLPRLPDARGFMTGVLAPGGCFYRIDPTGQEWELISNGFRNPYDAAFNRNGDLFTFDADMEWDMNTPWYRPTRVCLVTSGSEYGWRNGSGKWPPYYPDSLPPVLNVGPGSPTGMTFGYGAKFPARYQNALFLADWSYGRMYAVHLTPSGSSYTGELEPFLTGTPLPTTAILVNPKDGALYFITGGWRIQTGLYRITYAGPDSTAPAPPDTRGASARALRRRLEQFHGRQDPRAVKTVWPYLGSRDRFIRFAARVALEWQDPATWRQRALRERNPEHALNALLALVRVSGRDALHRPPTEPATHPALRAKVLAALNPIRWRALRNTQRLELMRVYALTFTRLGPPNETERQTLIARLDPLFPATTREMNAQLCQMLVYLQSPTVAPKAMALVAKAPTQEEQIEYIKSLRMLKAGWTLPLRRAYFNWFLKAAGYRGGASFAGFIRSIKKDALATLSDQERAELQPILDAKPNVKSPLDAMREALAGHQFVKAWTVDDLAPLLANGLKNRDFERGRKLFGGVGCFACHRFRNEGGAVGPDLTTAGGRFSPHDLLESIIEPSKTVSDLYAASNIRLADGDTVTGHIVYLGGDNVQVNTDMFDPSQSVNIDRKQIVSITLSKISPMPQDLLDVLHPAEIFDLMAYVLSGGDPANPMFRRPARPVSQQR